MRERTLTAATLVWILGAVNDVSIFMQQKMCTLQVSDWCVYFAGAEEVRAVTAAVVWCSRRSSSRAHAWTSLRCSVRQHQFLYRWKAVITNVHQHYDVILEMSQNRHRGILPPYDFLADGMFSHKILLPVCSIICVTKGMDYKTQNYFAVFIRHREVVES